MHDSFGEVLGLIIAFDTRVFCQQDRHNGIYAYASSLLLEFSKLLRGGSTTIKAFVDRGNIYGRSDWQSEPGLEVLNTSLLRFPRLWELGGVAFSAARASADVIFSPSYHTCPLGPVPVVATIHDATPVTSPSFGNIRNQIQKALLWNTAKFSRKCITDSECSRNDLIRLYGLPPEKVTVVYLGYDRTRFNLDPAEPQAQKAVCDEHGIRRPYILHHGAIQPRKNIERLIHAYRLLLQERPDWDFDLVIAGRLSWEYQQVQRTANETSSRGTIVFTGAVPSPSLPLLVKGASLCVIPSLYEGFCLPMVEAMACGVPTIASDTSCLPEVSGGVLRYFDPRSIENIAYTMESVLDDGGLQAELSRRGVQRAGEFSWERCARETLAILSASHSGLNGNGRDKMVFK
jgi:glycosyltransferase involved in cell wall biosynthesis